MDLRIGIENELFFQGPGNDPPPSPTENEVKFYAENKLVPFYNKKRGTNLLRSGFVDHSHPGHKKDHTDNDQWAVTMDATMLDVDLYHEDQNDQDVEGGAFEFVSPILSFCPDGAWKEEVKTHWATLLDIGRVSINNSCATHVHISRKAKSGPKQELDWTKEELGRVAQAVLYFDTAFDAILAPSRRGDFKTKSNRANNKKLGNRTFGECCKLIQSADLTHLVSLMQPIDSVQSDEIKSDRFYRWNLENTKEGDVDGNIDGKRRIGTIEFRCAPGVLTADHCLIWVVLAVYFVQAAAQFGTKETLEEMNGSSNDDLKRFILKAEPKNQNDIDILNIPFKHPGLDTDEGLRAAFDESLRLLGR